MKKRQGVVERKTKETRIKISLNIDGDGVLSGRSGIGFFDHMLTLLCFYAKWHIDMEVTGDIETGFHHTIEDIGIVLGQAVDEALGTREGITRFADVHQPMDSTLVLVAADLARRINLVYMIKNEKDTIEGLDKELFFDFFNAFVQNARMTLHINEYYSDNAHHLVEAVFKGVGRCLWAAMSESAGDNSTKGVI